MIRTRWQMGELGVSEPQNMHKLYEKLRRKKMVFRHVCEVGVYRPEAAHFVDFIRQGMRTTLIEANPEAAAALHAAFNTQNVSIRAVAVWDTHGTLTLSNAAASTFATALPSSPALENDHHRIHDGNTFEVLCMLFSTLDDGSIDLLGVDIEGGEWYVLKHLHSRPRVLCIETYGKYLHQSLPSRNHPAAAFPWLRPLVQGRERQREYQAGLVSRELTGPDHHRICRAVHSLGQVQAPV